MEQRKANPIDILVGQNIRRLRAARGFSQESLGDAIGITFQQIQKYEKGSNRISASKIYAVCGALNCQPSDLFAGADAISVTDKSSVPTMSAWAVRIAVDFDDLKTNSAKTAVRQFMKDIAEIEEEATSIGRRSRA